MKIVVQGEPDPAELALNGLEKEVFTVDQDVYCYFRDEIFLKGIEKFIRKTFPGKWKDIQHLENADKVRAWYENQQLIYKYYKKFKKQRKTFFLYKNDIYFYKLVGFLNVGNEIQLIKLDLEDILELLNRSTESVLEKLIRNVKSL